MDCAHGPRLKGYANTRFSYENVRCAREIDVNMHEKMLSIVLYHTIARLMAILSFYCPS